MPMFVRILQIAFFTCLTARSQELIKFSFERELMGTRFTIVCYANDEDAVEKAAKSAIEIGEKINQVASDYLPESELSLLSKKPEGKPVMLSAEILELLEQSLQVAKLTNGGFDPTLAPLSRLWRDSRKSGKLPDPEKLKAARASVGWQQVSLDPEQRSITLMRVGMAFDLGGIAKGYAADLMLASLAAAGLPQSMIVAGGDVRLGDPPPGRDGWNVAVQTFDLNQRDEILVLANAAVSTSGDLYQSVEIDGVKYSHILDPATGLGLTRRIAATVVADRAALSDPLATAACVMGADADIALKKIPGVRDVKIRTLQESPTHPRSQGSRKPSIDEK
jgi:thiamine biosynthesis lipoprotein